MKRIQPVLFSFLLLLFGMTWCPAEEQRPLPVIFDTDMDTDCDDLGAMAVLHMLAQEGKISILATMVSSNYPWSAPCVEAINRYYGRPDIPIGVPKTEGASIKRGSAYAQKIARQFPGKLKTNNDAPDAALMYRKLLAREKDHSVVIITVGYLTNLSNLLQSGPDQYSPLSGQELVRQKVKRYACMGGGYPAQMKYGNWGNFMPHPEATVRVVNEWPLSILFSVEGEKVLTGSTLDQTPENNPVRVGYKLYLGKNKTRPSWDQLAVLCALFPDDPCWNITRPGCNHIFSDGTNQWQ
ncbi:MAG: nucleoside hydrolase, partial [Thermoguttaceae bacterium]|nr:nucleoside hydrolase [Thermoguttaceae bacterium]